MIALPQQVLPGVATHDVVDRANSSLVLSGNRFNCRTRDPFGSDGDDILLRQFGEWMALATNVTAAVFSHSIIDVVFVCPKKEMYWVTAGRVVAAMQNAKTARNGSVSQQPCYAVGFLVRSRRHPECAVAATTSSLPLPAIIRPGDANLSPEPISDVLANLGWLVIGKKPFRLSANVARTSVVASGNGGFPSAAAMAESEAERPVGRSSGRIMRKHRNLTSGEPVGVPTPRRALSVSSHCRQPEGRGQCT